jgi:hypothetical protein
MPINPCEASEVFGTTLSILNDPQRSEHSLTGVLLAAELLEVYRCEVDRALAGMDFEL